MAAKPTWAQVARKKITPAFLETECAVKLEEFAAPQRLPPSSSRHSTFVPFPSSYQQSWAADIVTALPLTCVGIVPRADILLLEVCFANQEHQTDFLNSIFTCKHFSVRPVPPAGTPAQYVPIKLVNVPILAPIVIEQRLRTIWAPYGEVVATAPHTYKGTPFQSNRWDMVLKVSAGKSLSAKPFFDLLGFKVMASWPGSDKACPRCKETGHDSHTCPRRPALKGSKKRTTTTKQPQPSTVATAAPDVTAPQPLTSALTSSATADVAPTSDPFSIADMDTSADVDMADVSTSISAPLPSTSTTSSSSSSGPSRMSPDDLLLLTPTQLKALSRSVAPKSISVDLYMRLSQSQMDVLPTFISIDESPAMKPTPLPRTRTKNNKK